ncbi:unnamed protein product [Spirodela intermedia]|uniref:Uncharacterized protein n=1 Tax=Spirodela intermedia TaxID=51605 RepID=A0ABN7ED34_SPIIN|nr:unnamed protein product [Spirodela intermedia]
MRRRCTRILSVRRIIVQCPRPQGSPWTRTTLQEEALHRIWYALKRWRLVSRWIILFSTMACSSINRR